MAVANTNRIITHGDGQDIASAITSVSKAINDKDKNVLVTGDQTIQGLKSFETKPTFGGSEALNKTDLANGIAEAKGTLITKEQQDKCYNALKVVTKDFTRTDPVYVRVGEDGEPEIHYTMTQADGNYYFENMDLGKASLILHNTDVLTSAVQIVGLTKAKSLTIASGSFANMTDMSWVFAVTNWNEGFLDVITNETLDFPKKPKSTECMFHTFGGNRVPWFDTSEVTYAYAMFVNCYKLEEIPAYDFSKVTDFGLAFANLNKLNSFKAYGMKSSFGIASTGLKHDAILEVFNNLGTVDKTAGITLTLGSAKLALMSDAEKAIATEKGWFLA